MDAEATNLSASPAAGPVSGSQAHSGTTQECLHTSATLFLDSNLLDLRFILLRVLVSLPCFVFLSGTSSQ